MPHVIITMDAVAEKTYANGFLVVISRCASDYCRLCSVIKYVSATGMQSQ